MAKLRGPQGCPWDKEQTHQSLIPYALDEAYELVEVIEAQPLNDQKLKDELGDVLFQVLIHSQIAQEEGRFDFSQVMDTLKEKLIRRHPHVFNYKGPVTKAEVIENWEKIKAAEKELSSLQTPAESEESRTDRSSTVPTQDLATKVFKSPRYFTALQRAHSIGVKTEELGFDWPNLSGVLEKLAEEIAELQESINKKDRESIEEELGDVLFTLAQVSRKLRMDPERSAQQANSKFISRFQKMLTQIPQQDLESFKALNLEQKEDLWKNAKNKS